MVKHISSGNAGDTNQDGLQEYLDTLLMQATEAPEAQIKSAPISQSPVSHHQTSQNDTPPRAISDTPPRAIKVAAFKSPETPPAHSRRSTDQTTKARPYAEPAAPIKLKVHLPEVAPAVEVAEPLEATETITPDVAVEPNVDEPDVAVAEKPAPQLATPWLENGRPAWAQDRFECLLFSVGGLTLAVPLVELGSIQPMTEELTPLFGQAEWFMGLMPINDTNIRTVNTAKLVMPERYQPQMDEQFKYVISINGVDWGLAVDNVSEAICIDPEAVRWRSGRSKRPWLAGTVVEHMCALLDISQLAVMFHQQDRNLQP